MYNFYLICPPKLESILLEEIQEKFKLHFSSGYLSILEVGSGGIEIQCDIHHGLMLNHILRCPSKILLRIKKQKCRDLPKLYQIIKKINWKDYLNQSEVAFTITAKKSRIIHTKRIEDSALKAVSDYFEANKLKASIIEKYQEAPLPSLHIRLFEDELTISLDTSGELLHIRGDRSFRGHASIRENIAALLLRKLQQGLPQGDYNFIDPMCGTGTFLSEKYHENSLQVRQFNYQNFSQKLIEGLDELEFKEKSKPQHHFYGLDIDPLIIEKLDRGFIKAKQADLLKNCETIAGKNIVIINPPFGKRVKIKGDKVKFFENIYQQVIKLYSPVRFGMIIPRDFVGKLPGERHYFKLNGIEVCFLIIKS